MANITLTPTQVTDIKNAFAAADALLTFALNLTEEQRQRLYKAGNKLEVIQETSSGVANHAGIFPASFDSAGFLSNVDTFDTLTELTQIATGLMRKLDDTRMSVGSQCMQGVSAARTYIDAAAKTTPGLQPLSAQLAAHFKHQSPAPAAKPA